MRPAKSFAVLLLRGRRRLSRLKASTTAALEAGVSVGDRDRHLGYVVLEAQNLWSNFVRSYLLSLLMKPTRVLGGRIDLANGAVTTPGALLHVAAKAAKGAHAAAPQTRRDEPAWHDLSVFLRTSIELQPSNQRTIESALSIQTRVFVDLPTFRNFYAHRNQESAVKALALVRAHYMILKVAHPTEALASPATQRTQALLLDWLDDMGSVMELLCD